MFELLFEHKVDVTQLFDYCLGLPQYETGQYGEWEVIEKPDRPHKAYFNGIVLVGQDNLPMLRKSGTDLWMGISAREIESQIPHAHLMKHHGGRQAIVGLGMGFAVYCAWLNGADEIVVFEEDKEVVDLFYQTTEGIGDWDWVHEMMTVELVDVRSDDWEHKDPFEYCYVDIWLNMAEDRCRADMSHIAKRIHAGNYSFWTQEVDFVAWCAEEAHKQNLRHDEFKCGESQWLEYTRKLDFPMLLPGVDLDAYCTASLTAAKLCYED